MCQTAYLDGKELRELRVLGQAGKTYVIAEGEAGVYLVDQHAAHERVLLEDLRAALVVRSEQQLLLEPLVTSVAIKSLDRFSIGNALAQLTSTARVDGLDHAFGQVTGGLLLAGYAVVLVLAGAIVIQTRDVTD